MSYVAIDLLEWRDELREGLSFDDDRDARSAADALTQSGMVGITELRTGLRVQANSYVGRVELGGIVITIQPKIDGLPLWSLLRYAYGLRDLTLLPQYASYATASQAFHELLIRQLAAKARELIQRGIHRRYTPRYEDLSSPRGKIDMQVMARRGGVTQAALPCVHRPRLEDCLVNQVLLAGLQLAGRMAVDPLLRIDLHRLATQLRDDVSSIRLDFHTLRRLGHEMDRLVAAYRPAVAIIRVLVASQGVVFQHEDECWRLPGFLFDMNRFFQALLSRFLRENLENYIVHDEYSIRGMMEFVPDYNPRKRGPPVLRPDFVVCTGTKTVATLDAKYRDLWENGLPRHMLYQLAVYALTQEAGGRATILYPAQNPGAREERIRIIRDPILRSAHIRVASPPEVVLRPVNLKRLSELVAATGPDNRSQRIAFAHELAGVP